MHDKIRAHVEGLFEQAPLNRRTAELKDELIANLSDRYNDLVARGQDEFAAFTTVIDGIGDFDELIGGLRQAEQQDPEVIQMDKQKSALIVSSSVAIAILSFVFLYIGNLFGDIGVNIGMILTLICWAAAASMLIYNYMTKPKYEKKSDTMVENFKAWSSEKEDKKGILKLVSSCIWSLATMLFFVFGALFHAWHPAWLVFILAAVANNIVAIVFKMNGVK
jgi:hypothetical protein